MEDLRATIIQTTLHWEDTDRNLAMFSEKIAGINDSSDLIVLPEMFNTGFTMNPAFAETMEGKTAEWMKKTSSEKGAIITGSLIIKENGRCYNRFLWAQEGEIKLFYDKRHLFRMAGEHHHFSAGKDKIIAEVKGWRICPLICYDLRFPVWSRSRNDYDCLIYIANWPERRSHAWKILLQARAIENQCYVIGVNRVGLDGNDIAYSGDSAVIDPKGYTISTTPAYEENIETVTLSGAELTDYREKFPVSMDADDFEVKI